MAFYYQKLNVSLQKSISPTNIQKLILPTPLMADMHGYESGDTEPDTLQSFVHFMNPIHFMTSRINQFVDYILRMQLTELQCIKEAADATLMGSCLVVYMGISRFTALNALLRLPSIMNDYSRFQQAETTFDVYIDSAIMLQQLPNLDVWCYGCMTGQANQLAHTCM